MNCKVFPLINGLEYFYVSEQRDSHTLLHIEHAEGILSFEMCLEINNTVFMEQRYRVSNENMAVKHWAQVLFRLRLHWPDLYQPSFVCNTSVNFIIVFNNNLLAMISQFMLVLKTAEGSGTPQHKHCLNLTDEYCMEETVPPSLYIRIRLE